MSAASVEETAERVPFEPRNIWILRPIAGWVCGHADAAIAAV
jgi:hypothetical protein